MLEALSQAFFSIISWQHFIFLFSGVLLGLVIGVLPGLGGIAGLSLLLPFTYGLDPISGLALMVGVIAVIPTSDTFTSVLMGIPGSTASQATVLDGFPLAQEGKAASALGAAFSSSLFGGLVGAIFLTFFILFARQLILSFRTPELLLLTLFGFSMVGVLAGKNFLKGLVSALVGVLVGTVGSAPAQGSERLTFGSWYLSDGISLVAIGLGIFALPEIIQLVRKNQSISAKGELSTGWLEGFALWWKNKYLSIRCAVIGTFVGMIPGLGGSVVDWIAYGHTMQTTKDKSNFGKGEIRGVIGPESSNNAKEGGGLVPTLLFGIPGSGSMAIFLGGMVLIGLEAGPEMIRQELNTTYTIVWSLAIANVFGAGLCLILSNYIAKLTTIRFPLIFPFMILVISFATFQSKQTSWDLVALVFITLLGIFMKRFDWARPAFLIGFVLSDQAETYTYQLTQFIQFQGWGYLVSKTSIILTVILLVSMVLSYFTFRQKNYKLVKFSFKEKLPQVIFTGLMLLFAIMIFVDAILIHTLIDKIFPLILSAVGIFFTAILLCKILISQKGTFLVDEELKVPSKSMWLAFSWLIFLLVTTWIIGLFLAQILFFLVFLHYKGKIALRYNLLYSGLSSAGLLFLAYILRRDFPPGLLQLFFDLPWPIR
jgi:TctA family transporter